MSTNYFSDTGKPMSILALGSRHQLFLDDYVIDKSEGVEWILNPVEKFSGNPIIKSNDPRYQPTLYGSVIHDSERGYRMWHTNWAGHLKQFDVFHLISDDGVHWQESLNKKIKNGDRPSNIVFGTQDAPHLTEIFTVLHDLDEKDPEKRFKLIYKYREEGGPSPYTEAILANHREVFEDLLSKGKADLVENYRRVISDGLFLPTQRRAAGFAFSPDGIHWHSNTPLAIPEIGDISNLTWDPYRKRYLLYARDFFLPEDVHEKFKGEEWYQTVFWGRAVRLYESTDFVNWTAGGIVMHADIDDLPGDEVYSMAVIPYEGLYLGLVQMYHAFPGVNTLDIQLAVSRDGEHWKRVGNREPFIPLGGVGDWDRFNHSTASEAVLVNDEIRFYYSGRTYRHKPYAGSDSGPEKSAIGFGSVKRDRFLALGSSFEGGKLVTKPLILEGRTIHLNVECPHGSVIVRILDCDGQPLDGLVSKPVSLDSLDTIVEWPGNAPSIGSGKIKLIRLQFELTNAKLFAFWATN